jgi:hydroxyacylglutathione hydrolase
MKVHIFKVSSFFIKNLCYVVFKNNKAVLVDPAWNFSLINQFLIDNQLSLVAIVLTHAHFDHTHLAKKISKRYDVPVLMSGAEIDFYKFNCVNLERVEHLRDISFTDFTITPLLTPGHTFGSTCYLIEEHLFTGDTIFTEGVGMCNGKGSSAENLFDSVQFLKSYLSPATFFWPGHSFGQLPGKTLEFLLKNNIYFQFVKRDQFVQFRMRKNQSGPFNFS